MALATDIAPVHGTSPLAQWGLGWLRRYVENSQAVRAKYQRNLDNFRGNIGGLELWRRSDARNSDEEGRVTHVPSHVNATQQKVKTMHAMLVETAFSGGEIPFFLEMDDLASAQLDPILLDKMHRNMTAMEGLMRYQQQKTKSDQAIIDTVESMCLYGRGWAKRVIKPVDVSVFVPVGFGSEMRWVKQTRSVNMPAIETRSVWNMFRDMESRDAKHYQRIFEVFRWSAYDLRQIQDGDLNAIDRVLSKRRSGDMTDYMECEDPYLRDIMTMERSIRMVEMWGLAPRRYVDAYFSGKNMTMGDPEELGDDVRVRVLFADDEVIRVDAVDPKELGFNHPYLTCECERSLDWHDTGIADKAEHMQRVINGLMNNIEKAVKYASNIILAMKKSAMEGDIQEFEHGLTIHLNEHARNVSDAIQQFRIDDVSGSARNLMELARQFLDEDSMVPRQSQGQPTGDRVTAFEVSTRIGAADRYRGTVVRNIDEQLIEPAMQWQLDYNLNDPQYAHLAGPFSCSAAGMTRYRNRTEQSARMREFMGMIAQVPQMQMSPALMQQWDLFKMSTDFARMLDLPVEQYLSPLQLPPAGMDGPKDPNVMNDGVPGMPPAPMQPGLPPRPGEFER
jgi:hypothetical protein